MASKEKILLFILTRHFLISRYYKEASVLIANSQLWKLTLLRIIFLMATMRWLSQRQWILNAKGILKLSGMDLSWNHTPVESTFYCYGVVPAMIYSVRRKKSWSSTSTSWLQTTIFPSTRFFQLLTARRLMQRTTRLLHLIDHSVTQCGRPPRSLCLYGCDYTLSLRFKQRCQS